MKIRHRDDYRLRRVQDYPPISEFADAMVHQAAGDPSKLDAYFAACRAVKDRYPKPASDKKT